MGKKIVIIGADFSANAVIGGDTPIPMQKLYNFDDSWYDAATQNNTSLTAGPYTPSGQTSILGKNVYGVRLKTNDTGTITIYKASKTPSTSSPCTVTEIQTFNVTPGIQNLMFTNPVRLSGTEVIAIQKSSDTARFVFRTGVSNAPDNVWIRSTSSPTLSANTSTCVDIYFKDE